MYLCLQKVIEKQGFAQFSKQSYMEYGYKNIT